MTMNTTEVGAITLYGDDAEEKWELVQQLHRISPQLGEWADDQFKLTCSIRRLKYKLRRAMNAVESADVE